MDEELIEEEELEEFKDPSFNEDDSSETPPTDIVAYNELRSCADLARMTDDGIIDLQPHFQREIVWSPVEQTRFIDSLVKQLPIPSMCFALDHKTDTWIVIDGLQRMTAIVRFLGSENWRLSKVEDIDEKLSGKTSNSFKLGSGEVRKVFDRVQNKTLPVTVLRCDFTKKPHMEYLFTVFHRLNSGGSKLNNQEIRNCIYSGVFNNLLKELDLKPEWRQFNKMLPVNVEHPEKTKQYRFVKQEIILRFFAFVDRAEKYKGQVAKFLNDYMHDLRNIKDDVKDAKRTLFNRTMAVVSRIFPDGPEGKLPTAVIEALLVGIGRNIDHAEALPDPDLVQRYTALRASVPFSEEGLAEGLSKKEKVESRLLEATNIFAQ